MATGLIQDAFTIPTPGPITLKPYPRPAGRMDRPSFAGAPEAPIPLHVKVAAERYDELEVELDPSTRTYWCHFKPQGRPSFTPGLLHDLKRMQASLRQLGADQQARHAIEYFVVASRLRKTFNLGGDLTLFADCIRRGDRERLRSYAVACIDVLHENAVSYGLPLVTIGLVQGDALGGGFEAALSCDVIIAERSAKFGLPEVLFNLFPGMGAYSFLSRRLDAARAEKIILSGKVFDAAELQAMGLVDVLAEDGEGETAVRDYTARHGRRHNAQRSLYEVKRRVQPLPYQELEDVIDIWVAAALALKESDLRRMERLTQAQNRRQGSAAAVSAPLAG